MSATDEDLTEVIDEPQVPEAEAPPEPEAVTSEDEMERLDPVPDTYTFADGTTVSIERLKTRQFFKLLRIITHGGMDALQTISARPEPRDGAVHREPHRAADLRRPRVRGRDHGVPPVDGLPAAGDGPG